MRWVRRCRQCLRRPGHRCLPAPPAPPVATFDAIARVVVFARFAPPPLKIPPPSPTPALPPMPPRRRRPLRHCRRHWRGGVPLPPPLPLPPPAPFPPEPPAALCRDGAGRARHGDAPRLNRPPPRRPPGTAGTPDPADLWPPAGSPSICCCRSTAGPPSRRPPGRRCRRSAWAWLAEIVTPLRVTVRAGRVEDPAAQPAPPAAAGPVATAPWSPGAAVPPFWST